MFKKIEIDFDVYKKLTVMRDNPQVTENDVIRKLLNLPPIESFNSNHNLAHSGKAWTSKGISLPEGTKLKAEYKGRQYNAEIRDGAIYYDGENYTTPSSAATAVTNTQINGWRFWEYKSTETEQWQSLYELRKK